MEGSTSGEREGLLAGPYGLGGAVYWPDEGDFYLLAVYCRCPLFGLRIGLQIMGRGQMLVKKRMVSRQVRKCSAPATVPRSHRRAPRSRARAWPRRHSRKWSGFL
jgi:hypothetical protein